MAQITSGLWRFLTRGANYDLFQNLLGGSDARKRLCEMYLPLFPGIRILDLGCGTANILEHLPRSVDYVGIDLSEAYIRKAKQKHGARGRFFCADVNSLPTFFQKFEVPGFDLVIAFGVLHHLDDVEVAELFGTLVELLQREACLITVDPCFLRKQRVSSRILVKFDRGRNVRDPAAYLSLARRTFSFLDHHHHSDLLRVPYDHFVMIASNPHDPNDGPNYTNLMSRQID